MWRTGAARTRRQLTSALLSFDLSFGFLPAFFSAPMLRRTAVRRAGAVQHTQKAFAAYRGTAARVQLAALYLTESIKRFLSFPYSCSLTPPSPEEYLQ